MLLICVFLLPPAIPTVPPTVQYPDYPYPDAGEWYTVRDNLTIDRVEVEVD